MEGLDHCRALNYKAFCGPARMRRKERGKGLK